MVQDGSGYSPNTFTIKKGIPVKWIITSKSAFTCAASIISPKLGVRKNLQLGENIIEFTPSESGNIRFTCSMGMYGGSFNVIDDSGKVTGNSVTDLAAANPAQQVAIQKGTSGSCGGGCGCGQKAQRAAAIEADKTPPVIAENVDTTQVIKATYSVSDDIKPNKFTVKIGTPVRFDVTALDDGQGCMGSIMIPGLDDRPQGFEKDKVTTLAFTPNKPGSYTITCAMGVPRGTILVE
jgi:plastocyanin domain-containing protein